MTHHLSSDMMGCCAPKRFLTPVLTTFSFLTQMGVNILLDSWMISDVSLASWQKQQRRDEKQRRRSVDGCSDSQTLGVSPHLSLLAGFKDDLLSSI